MRHVGRLIERGAEPGKPCHYTRPHAWRILAYAGREDESIHTTECGREEAGTKPDAIGKIV